jgi:two-component system, NarL family, nitrate/nitrite response regulator NarL
MTIPQLQNEGSFPASRTTVLVSEASKMYCDLLSMALYAVQDRFHVVGAASKTTEILKVIQECRPQVVIISDHLEDGPFAGIRILPAVRRLSPATRILAVLGASNRESIIEAFRFGADGVFCRKSPFELLWKSLEAIAQGEIWANATEIRYVLDEFMKVPKPRVVDSAVAQRMTKRESDVARAAVEGLSNREIARALGLSEHTVKNYLFKIFDKLGVSNRVELVLSCLRQEEAADEEAAANIARSASQPGASRNMAMCETERRSGTTLAL